MKVKLFALLLFCFSLAGWPHLGPSPLSAQTHPFLDAPFQPVVTGLDLPLAITHAGDGSGRLFITLQGGQIVVYDGEAKLETPFLDLSASVSCCGERGLLSTAFHPNYETNGFFYVDYTDQEGAIVVSRFQVSDDPNTADPASETVLLRIPHPNDEHNGGQLQFGPDGYLYIATGDGGGAGDRDNNAQNLGSLLGKILRIDVDGGAPYGIPPTNPFLNDPNARDEIWIYGLRNPWRFSFDRASGDLLLGDVGQRGFEEIDFQAADSAGGENYGWRLMEAESCFEPAIGCNDGTLTLPILSYPHGDGSCGGSVIGGYRYRGAEFPQLQGTYIFGDFCSGELFAANEQDGAWTSIARAAGISVSTFGQDEEGELYVADYSIGTVFRMTSSPTPALTLLSPASTASGAPAFTMTLVGSNFVAGSEVLWNGNILPTAFVDATRLQATVAAADIAEPGLAQVTVVNPPPSTEPSEVLEFEIVPDPELSPVIGDGGVVNGATFRAPVSPGSLASVFGVDLAVNEAGAPVFPLAGSLGGAHLVFDGSLEAPAVYASAGQVNIQIPFELEGRDVATLTAAVGASLSGPATVALARFSPGIFLAGTGADQGAVTIGNTGGALAAPAGARPGSRPARRREVLEIYATGLGPVTNPPGSGQPARRPLSETTPEKAQVQIGGIGARVFYSGLAPGYVGVYQVNAEVPPDSPGGDAVTLEMTIGGVASNTVTVAVE